MIYTDQMQGTGVNDQELDTGVNVYDGDEEIDEDLDTDMEDENLDDDGISTEDEDDEEIEQSQQNQNPKKIDKVKRLHATITNQNKLIKQLQRDIATIKEAKSNNVSDEDLEALKEKYGEDDLTVIQKLAEKAASNIVNQQKKQGLQQRELNIFLKKFPDISEPELRHVQDLQNRYWYSLERAYRQISGNVATQSNTKKVNHSIGWSLKGWSGVWQKVDENEAAYEDMVKNYT